jgi:gas vesicle protein
MKTQAFILGAVTGLIIGHLVGYFVLPAILS